MKITDTTDRLDHLIWISVIIIIAAGIARGEPIAGFRPSINFTGFDPSPTPYTYVPIKDGKLKPEYAALVATLKPRVGREMDLRQINDNNEVNWTDIPTTDFGRNGVRVSTDVNIANQMRGLVPDYAAQVNLPAMSTDDYAFQAGKYWGANFTGDTIYVGLGNELWNVFYGNLAHWNLLQARAEGYQGDDFRVLGLRQGARLGGHVKAFLAGVRSVGSNKRVVMEIEGFAPIPQYAQNQIDGMRAAGIEPAAYGARVSIAQYAFGSASDAQGMPLGTAQEKAAAVKAFIDTLKTWTLAHKALALANGLSGVVDAYELRFGTKPVTAADVADWVAFQDTPEQRQVQDYGWHQIVAAAGVDANLSVEGVYGFPMDAPQGQFPLLAMDRFDSRDGGAYLGTLANIDFSGVPEPAALLMAAAAGLLMRRRAA